LTDVVTWLVFARWLDYQETGGLCFLFTPYRTTDSLSAFYAGGISLNAFSHSVK